MFCSSVAYKYIPAFLCGFSMGRNQYWARRVYDLCVYYMTGTPEGSTESGFTEKPGIEPATPGLQGMALIHYTTGASHPCFGKMLKQLTTKTKKCSCHNVMTFGFLIYEAEINRKRLPKRHDTKNIGKSDNTLCP